MAVLQYNYSGTMIQYYSCTMIQLQQYYDTTAVLQYNYGHTMYRTTTVPQKPYIHTTLQLLLCYAVIMLH